jgi:hypothetical protein
MTTPLGQLQIDVQGAHAQIAAAADPPVSLSSANPYQTVIPPAGNKEERSSVRNYAGRQQALLDKVLGAIHGYVTERHQQLRFGSAVETSFEVVRAEVDRLLGELVPDGP